MQLAHALAALALAAAATGVCAQPINTTWKWRDAAGVVHASDRPPPSSVPDSAIFERPHQANRGTAAPAPKAASAPAAAGSAPRVDLELEARRRRAVDDQLAQKKVQEEKDAAVRAENCSRARGHLVALQDGQRLVRTNAQGEREALDDKGRAEEMQRARSIIASDCAR
ncbi:MAG TPA: DUF4124 domain-containing protein [Burkholderiaceae bacterium]|nr:DUF4124 domain-containing protein [Burkholderiaceae bacterium]